MSDEDYNPYLPNGSDNRTDTKDGPGLTDFLPDVSGGYKATAGAPLAGPAGPADGDIVEAALKTVHDPEIPVNIYDLGLIYDCLLYTSPSPRDRTRSRMPSSA